MDGGTEDHDGKGSVQSGEWILNLDPEEGEIDPPFIEEHDVAKSENQPRESHRHHGEKPAESAEFPKGLPFFNKVGKAENQDCPQTCRSQRKADAVQEADDSCAVERCAEIEMGQGKGHMIGPYLYESRQSDDANQEKKDQSNQAAIDLIEDISPPGMLWFKGNRLRRELIPRVLFLKGQINQKRDHRRNRQNESDHSSHGHLLLPDHLPIDIGRQHIVISPDDLRRSEIRKGHRETGNEGIHQTITDGGKRYPEKRPGRRRTKNLRRFIEPVIRIIQRNGQDHIGLRETVDHQCHHNPLHPVQSDIDAKVDGKESHLPENINQRHAMHHGRNKNRNQSEVTVSVFPPDSCSRDAIGIQEPEDCRYGSRQESNRHGMSDRGNHQRIAEIIPEILQSHIVSHVIGENLTEHHDERHDKKNQKPYEHHQDHDLLNEKASALPWAPFSSRSSAHAGSSSLFSGFSSRPK